MRVELTTTEVVALLKAASEMQIFMEGEHWSEWDADARRDLQGAITTLMLARLADGQEGGD
jgi:hypothetical protein